MDRFIMHTIGFPLRRPAVNGPISLAILCTASKSPRLATGKPALLFRIGEY
jgi:hypothetical protein